MNLILAIKNIIIYKEPKNNQIFELLEDEHEDMGYNDLAKTPEMTDSTCDSHEEDKHRAPPKGVKKLFRGLIKTGERKKDSKATNGMKLDQNKDNCNNVSKELKKNLQRIKREFHFPTNQDIIIREFKVMQEMNAFIVYVDGMIDKDTINEYILRQLMTEQDMGGNTKISVDYIADNLLAVNQIKRLTGFDQAINQILNGLTALFVEGSEECIIIESRGYEKRNVTAPAAETVIKGPHEGFTENLRTNLTSVRKILRNKELVTEIMPLGKTNNLTCAIMYIQGLTNPKIVQEVKRRIASLDIDLITGNGGLEQLIEDHPLSLFPQLLTTERPDKTAIYLMNGKVAIICDGSPNASLAPITFFDFFQSSEDTYLRWQFSSSLKFVRWVACGIAMFMPGLFIAITLYHQEMIPSELLFALSRARENIPIPTLIEMLAMEISFELMREAGLRVPGAIGQTLGIIGAIVLGQAAVAAGLVSPMLIMIVSITGLSSFAIPNYSIAFAIRLMRFVFIFFGAIAGIYGLTAGICIFGGLACSLKSFGVPYFSPVAPKTKGGFKVGIMPPPWMFKERPDFLNTNNRSKTGGTVRGWTRQNNSGNSK